MKKKQDASSVDAVVSTKQGYMTGMDVPLMDVVRGGKENNEQVDADAVVCTEGLLHDMDVPMMDVLRRGNGTPSSCLNVPPTEEVVNNFVSDTDTQGKTKRIIEHFREQCLKPTFASAVSMITGYPGASFHPNKDLVAGNPSYDKFFNAVDRGLPEDSTLRLVYHGSYRRNLSSILRDGLDPTKRCRQKYGPGEYFTRNPQQCLTYNDNCPKVLVFVVVLPSCRQEQVDSLPSSIVLINNNEHQIPIGILDLKIVKPHWLFSRGEAKLYSMQREFEKGNFPSHKDFVEHKRNEIDAKCQKAADPIIALQDLRKKKLAELSAQLDRLTKQNDDDDDNDSSTTSKKKVIVAEKLQRLTKLHASRKEMEDVRIEQAKKAHKESTELLEKYHLKFWFTNLLASERKEKAVAAKW